ncbi:MAG: ferritin family protein [Alphaproteobacteria bacterium]
MGLLKAEPAGRVASIDELIAIAHAMEREAGKRYRQLSQRMRIQGEDDVAALFAFLADIENKHADQVDARSRLIVGKAPDPADIRWELPENFDEEEANSYLLTPYRALAIAVRNEERAFAFYSYLAAGSDDDKIRQFAEDFAKDELDHAGLLRRERRKAWRREGRDGPLPKMEKPESVDVLRRQAVAMERAATEGHRALAAALRVEDDPETARLFDEAAADEEACAGSIAAKLGGEQAAAVEQATPSDIVDGLRLLEFAFERYSDIVETASDEAVMLEAQILAERALRRLTRVRGSIGNELLSGGRVNAAPVTAEIRRRETD